MSNFLKYMRLFALGITFSSSMALPYVQIKFYDVFREATQASNNELGLLMTIFTAVSMALYIPGGVLADRGSPKKLLLLSLIMMCGLNAYFAFHTSYGAAQLIWALLAIAANTVQWPTLIKAIRDTGSSEEQGRMFGTFYGTTGIFSSIIGFVGAWIYSNGSSNIEGFHLMLLGQSAFCAVAAVARAHGDGHFINKWRSHGHSSLSLPGSPAGDRKTGRARCPPRLRLLCDLFVNRDLLAILVLALELHDAVHEGEERVVLTLADVDAGVDLRSALSDEDVAGQNKLTVGSLGAKALRLTVAAVLGGTHAFFMCHFELHLHVSKSVAEIRPRSS